MVERTGEVAEQSNFRILQDYFRDKFYRYFEGVTHAKWLIMEESLYSVIYFLLNPIPEQLNVLGSSILVSNKVSQSSNTVSNTTPTVETVQSARAQHSGLHHQTRTRVSVDGHRPTADAGPSRH